MNEAESTQKVLFKNDAYLNNSMNLVIEDREEIQKYPLEKIKNKVIWGETFKVLTVKKYDLWQK